MCFAFGDRGFNGLSFLERVGVCFWTRRKCRGVIWSNSVLELQHDGGTRVTLWPPQDTAGFPGTATFLRQRVIPSKSKYLSVCADITNISCHFREFLILYLLLLEHSTGVRSEPVPRQIWASSKNTELNCFCRVLKCFWYPKYSE